MIEIYKNLYIGNELDYEGHVKNDPTWQIVHACKEPYHRQLLGYTGRGAPKDHPEYLFAHRENRLYLNIVDAADPAYIPKEIIDVALDFMKQSQNESMPCLVHCNQGESRSPSIGFLYMAAQGLLKNRNFIEAENEFRKIYPTYNPKSGIRGFVQMNWAKYVKP